MVVWKNKKALFKLLQQLPLVIMLVITILFVIWSPNITVDGLLSYSPSSRFLAALCLIGLYAIKSLSVVFPILVLYLCAGFLFSPLIAMLVNILGVIVCLSIPYWIGYHSGTELTDWLLLKYPKVKKLNTLKQNNPFFLPFFTRIIGFLPGDIVSLLLGSRRVPYHQYLLGSLAGMLPGIICVTLLGDSIADPASWQFFVSLIITVVISGGSLLLYWTTLRSKASKDRQNNP
jgi:uncharacterized membrane protein YdjX (TVP38/TMEM64 family)